MLSGPSFRSAFVFSIDSLILSGFPLTTLHLAKASRSDFSWLYTLVCILFIIIRILSIYSFYNQPVLFA